MQRETEQDFYLVMKEKKKQEEEREKDESGSDGYRAFLSVESAARPLQANNIMNINAPPSKKRAPSEPPSSP